MSTPQTIVSSIIALLILSGCILVRFMNENGYDAEEGKQVLDAYLQLRKSITEGKRDEAYTLMSQGYRSNKSVGAFVAGYGTITNYFLEPATNARVRVAGANAEVQIPITVTLDVWKCFIFSKENDKWCFTGQDRILRSGFD